MSYNVKILFLKNSSTILGNVVEETDTKISIKNPTYVIPSEKGTQLLPFMEMSGVAESEDTIVLDKSELLSHKLHEPLAQITQGWHDTFHTEIIYTPKKELLLG